MIVTRDEWLALPPEYRTGVPLDALRPISERDFACYTHWLLSSRTPTPPETIQVRTTAPGELLISIGHTDPFIALAIAEALRKEADVYRDVLPIGLRLSYEGVATTPT